MRRNEPVSQRAVPVGTNANILSTTDQRGWISHVNQDFIDISGYTRDELIGQPHNILRHPDMPRLAFEDMWAKLKSGRSWMGLVKNRCKNGDHYWVTAYATPIVDGNGQTVEYQSIRTAPPDEACIQRAEAAYRRLRNAEPDKGAIGIQNRRAFRLPLGGRLGLLYLLAASPLFAVLAIADGGVAAAAAAFLGGAALFGAGQWWLLGSLQRALREARSVIDDPLAERLFIGSNDEAAGLRLAMFKLRTELDAVTKRLSDSAVQLEAAATAAERSTSESAEAVGRQSEGTQGAASASEEMSQTLQEIARNTSDAAECAATSQSQGNEAGRLMERTREAMDRLAERMQISSQTVERLAESSREIGTVLEVINGVAQQTSLLALNASIEAARAGDSGRGFAVVADEVRELATRTQQSTGEIQAIIDRLQGSADEATQSMEENHLEVERTRESSVESLRQLEQLINGFEEITGLTAQIASATEQQTTAAGQLSGNISEISQLADSAKSASTQCVERISAFAEEVRRMRGLVNQFQR